MKEWFWEQVDKLFDGSGEVPQQMASSVLVNELIQNTYTVIAWEHVVKASRPGY